MSDAAYKEIKESYEDVLEQIAEHRRTWANETFSFGTTIGMWFFLQAIHRQFTFYEQRGIDMFKQDISGMVDVEIPTYGTLHTSSDQWSIEEGRQTSGGRVVHSNEDGVSVPWLLLLWTPVHPTRGERRQRETHDITVRRDPKEHRLPTSLCQCRRAVGMRVERHEKRPGREKVSVCAVDDDVTADPDRRVYRNRVRYDRVQLAYGKHCVRTLPRYSPYSKTSI